ncbi:hypothetical protein ADN00_16170 [Ornatilinea apprima]|uniref:Uncharacterized protein n=1 Tax=Ornatilinea apprima TaxID=1134406 RepID=A0A0P6WSP8_9CHLR|nr:hypothetical protein [Ornatilinea apprima]KPL72023.1 hypothetical protein ADN00_16170 [Ornatilinea apprima]
MNDASQFTIDIPQFRALGSLVLASRAPLANLAPLLMATETNISMESLRSAKLVDSEGQIAPYLHSCLRTITNANRVSQIFFLQSDDQILSNLVYYTPDPKSQGLQIDEQGQIQFLEESSLKNVVIQSFFNHQVPIESRIEYTITLTSSDALVLSTLIDMQRMEYLQTAANETTVFKQMLSAQKVADFLDHLGLGFNESDEQETYFDSNALSPNRGFAFLISMLTPPTSLTLQEINTSFVRLAKAGWLVPFQMGYTPGNAILSISRDFLEMERVAFLETHTIKNECIASEEMLCIGMAGKYFTFLVDSENENRVSIVSYTSLSGADLLSKFFRPAQNTSNRIDSGVNQEMQANTISGTQPPPLTNIQTDQEQEPVFPSARKRPRSFWIAVGFAMISILVMCFGCGLAAWAFTW